LGDSGYNHQTAGVLDLIMPFQTDPDVHLTMVDHTYHTVSTSGHSAIRSSREISFAE